MQHRVLLLVLAVSLLFLNSACFSVLGEVRGGVVDTLNNKPNRTGLGLDAHMGIGLGDGKDSGAGIGIQSRNKFSSSTEQTAVGGHFYMFGGPVFGRLGFNALQFEKVDKKSSFGMLSPFADVGLVTIGPKKGGGITLGGTIEYDVRFSDVPNEPYVGLYIGWALMETKSVTSILF